MHRECTNSRQSRLLGCGKLPIARHFGERCSERLAFGSRVSKSVGACFAALVAGVLWAGVASADESPLELQIRLPALPSAVLTEASVSRASLAYEKASRYYERGQLKPALSAALDAFEALPNSSTALVVATVLAELSRPCEALDSLLLALDLGPTDSELAAAKRLLQSQAAACSPGWAWLNIAVRPAGATVSVGESPLPVGRTFAMPAGTYVLRAQAVGHEPAQSWWSAPPGGGGGVSLTLHSTPPVEQVVVADPPAPVKTNDELGVVTSADAQVDMATADGRGSDQTVAWALIGSGSALSAVGGLCLGLAVAAAGDASAAAQPGTGDVLERKARYDRAAQKAQRLEIAGWTVGVAGLSAVIAGIVLYVASDEEPAHSFAPQLLPGGAGVGWSVRF